MSQYNSKLMNLNTAPMNGEGNSDWRWLVVKVHLQPTKHAVSAHS